MTASGVGFGTKGVGGAGLLVTKEERQLYEKMGILAPKTTAKAHSPLTLRLNHAHRLSAVNH